MTRSTNDKKRALLILPTSFYTFGDFLSKEMERAGFAVVIANDEYPNNSFGKILGKLGIQWLLSAVTHRTLYSRFIRDKNYDLIVIIKGRGISPALLDQMKACSPRIVAYNFDSLRYHPAPLVWYDKVAKYCTFDHLDAEKYHLPLVELFSSVPPSIDSKTIRYDVSAILRNHSERLQYVDEVLRLMSVGRVYIYIFEQNIFTFLINFAKNPALYHRYWNYIHFTSLPYHDYSSILRASNFTVDYAHPKQSGTTIRCFEALSAQTKIITNNAFVMKNPQFSDDNTIVHQNGSDPDETRKKIESLRLLTPKRYHRSISDFLVELLA